jgi:DNA-directed RNA polymerase subunit RPC12/RpoP
MQVKGKWLTLESGRCGFCGKMSQRCAGGTGLYICERCVHRFLASGDASARTDVQCAYCGKAMEGGRRLFEGLPPLKARGVGIAPAELSGPTGQMAVCSDCLQHAIDIVG